MSPLEVPLLLLTTIACARHATTSLVSPGDGAKVDDYLRRLEVFGMSGSILVAEGDDVVLRQGYGLADRVPGTPITPDTPFVIGSLSKQFTAAAIVKLESEGRLSVDDRLERFFPAAPADKRDITVAELLTHTSGLPYLPANDLLAPSPRPEVMAEMLGLPLAGRGTYSYSTPGYTLLAGVVEAASGRSYEDYVASELFRPAGMRSTGFMGEDRWKTAATHSYSGTTDEGPFRDLGAVDRGVGAGTVVTTPGDLWRWVEHLRHDDAASRALWTPRVPTGRPDTAFGYGWNIVTTPKGRVVTHAGDLGGYNAECRIYLDRGVTIVFFSNGRPSGAGYREAVLNATSQILAGEPHPEPPRVSGTPDPALSGTWRLADGTIDVRVDGGIARLSADSQEGISILAGPPDAALSGTALAVATGMAAGDYAALQASLHPSLPFAGMQGDLDAANADRIARLGPLVGVDLLGTAVTGPRSARSWFRLRHERGDEVGALGWVDGKILGIDGQMSRAAETVFAPEGPARLAAYDMFTGATVRAAFDGDHATFSGPGGDATATR